ncbi:MAG TPA: DUF4215 domain-containing protein, partial [Polyangiaceae bacterium]|nr:DUF4215 domain-containing protein [Polyangiaceae bacterium]
LTCYGGPKNGQPCATNTDCGTKLQDIGLSLSEHPVDNDTTVSRSVKLLSTGHKRLFIATAGLEHSASSGGNVSGMTFNGVAMTLATVATSTTGTNGTTVRSYIFYLKEVDLPPVGTYTLTATVDAASGGGAYGALELDNVDQTTPIEATGTKNNLTTATISTTLTTQTAGAWLIDVVASGNETTVFTATSSQSKLDADPSSCQVAIGMKSVASAGSATMSWSLTNANRTSQAVVAVRPAQDFVSCQADAGDGCDDLCKVDPGWTCPFPNTSCVASTCGDGYLTGSEQCERSLLSDTSPNAACTASCTITDGYACDWDDTAHRLNCVATASACDNDGVRELGEPCDDGNNNIGDGCNPYCEREPDCSARGTTTGCVSACGDGMLLAGGSEQCDDGNTVSGDGCDSTCQTEPGWTCAVKSDTLPTSVDVPVAFRDFNRSPTAGNTQHMDFETFSGSAATLGLVQSAIGANNKPVYTGKCEQGTTFTTAACPYGAQTTSKTAYDQWYNDTPGVNVTLVTRLPFAQQGTTNTYKHQNNALFPFDGTGLGWVAQGKENASNGHNFGFTSELKFWFEYKGNELLDFSGDDDVWVFVNGKLAVDLGGLHSQTQGSVTLTPGAVQATYNLLANRIYEIALFHAERHTSASNFVLTLGGFNKGKSTCTAKCGDGVVVGGEQCDDGSANANGYGTCQTNCKIGLRCGDGIVTSPQEKCDNGVNQGGYGSGACSPGCVIAPSCGDGVVQAAFGETCDAGSANGTYGGCGTDCRQGPYCGDGIRNGLEVCDDGANNAPYGSASCASGCVAAPKCGDGLTNAAYGEECDDGNLASGDGCSNKCRSEAICGNGVKEATEQCDDHNSQSGDGCSSLCKTEFCGDGVPQAALGEQCDDHNTTSGDGCSATCKLETICGNGTREGAEQCDDGNKVNNDGCSSNCTTERCGDGVKQTSEQCDDGNAISGDGCSKTCQFESICGNGVKEGAEQCDDSNTVSGDGCSAGCQTEICGDGITQALRGEECDDGNVVAGDGCSAICKRETICGNGVTEAGEQCDDHNTTSGDGCTAACKTEYCGDGTTQLGLSEDCDDGNTVSGDGCSNTCSLETYCGNGVKEGVEQCDDHNNVSGDGCSGSCKTEFCGDGLTQSGLGEQCDDHNNVSGDGCSAACKVEIVCGNGALEGAEQCDDHNNVSGDGCSSTCQIEVVCGNGVKEGVEQCDDGNNSNNDGCSSSCRFEFCGDSAKQSSEQCDDGNNSSGDGCSATCKTEICGDGALHTALGEECDDGNTKSGDGCSASCKIEAPTCGNGKLEGAEQCDDGNTVSGDGCRSNCTREVCGDGVLDPSEVCDDGNTASGDGCSKTCKSETYCGNGKKEGSEQCDDGNNSSGDGCSSVCKAELCGDGTRQPALGEQCDDGNLSNGDGCSATCKLETVCGNKLIEGAEECDDGNTAAADGCSATCQLEVCGNGVLDAGEGCDDHNTTSGDGCSNKCKLESFCGNGTVEGVEQCDDHNNVSGDGCSSTCRREICGDGLTQVPLGEQCDDHNTASGDGCSSTCKLETACGNGVIEGVEQCDDSNQLNNDGCSSTCQLESCGDGVQQATEECDDGNHISGDGCSAACKAEVRCGDGSVNQASEQCDDGNNASGDGCSSTCKKEFCGDGITQAPSGEQCDDGNKSSNDGCSSTCKTEYCGDGVKQSGEACDDGNTASGDGCTPYCTKDVVK